MKKFSLIVLAAVMLAACGEAPKEKSESMKKAEEVHETLVKLSGDVADMMHAKIGDLEAKMEGATAQGDSLMAVKLDSLNQRLESLHSKFHEWEENMVEIPGHAHSHDHDHEHGEHCDHDHDHEQNKIMEGISDEEHLEIQQEQLRQIEELKKEIETVSVK